MQESIFKNKIILVTGGTGSIGLEIVKQLLEYKPKAIRILARNEDGHYQIMQGSDFTSADERILRFMIGDVRDRDRLKMAMEGANIVFHAAALKQVPMCEYSPFEAVKTNIIGTQNIIDLARELGVDRVVAISTDKVVDPTSVMGASKLMAEKLILSSYYYQGNKKTKFCCVRFGNVLGSRGSILPLIKKQVLEKGEITLTDPNMTRFVMTIPQAVNLVLTAATLTKGQEVFVLKMPAVRIGNLIEAAVKYYALRIGKKPSDIKIKIIGKRDGEKDHEELLANYEIDRVLETKDMYILTPHAKIEDQEYNETYPTAKKGIRGKDFISVSASKLSQKELENLIKEIEK